MEILYATQRVPFPPNRGDKLAAYHAVRHLARSHRVTVAAPADSSQELENAEALRGLGVDVLTAALPPWRSRLAVVRALLAGRPLSPAFFASEELQAGIARRAALRAFDVAVSFSSSTGPYVAGLATPFVADFVDLDSRKWALYAAARPWPLSRLYALEEGRLLRYERELAGQAYRTLVRTEAERQDCVRLIPGGRFEVLRNGVDLDYFVPAAAPATALGVVFTGVMDYFPNVEAVRFFCGEVWPLVIREEPRATFTIVGSRPTHAVRALARHPGVVVTGFVPEVLPFLHGARLAVAPLRLARGVQNKVLEAMAAGLPVVATRAAFRGVGCSEGEGVLVAEAPEELAALVLRLLRDPALALEQGAAGRRYVERHHRWEDALAVLEQILRDAAASGRSATR